MEKQVNLKRNKVFHLEVSMVMYGTYNAETMENWLIGYKLNIIKQHRIKGYLWVSLIIGIIDIFLQKELCIIL